MFLEIQEQHRRFDADRFDRADYAQLYNDEDDEPVALDQIDDESTQEHQEQDAE
jgi:hypothetical protein